MNSAHCQQLGLHPLPRILPRVHHCQTPDLHRGPRGPGLHHVLPPGEPELPRSPHRKRGSLPVQVGDPQAAKIHDQGPRGRAGAEALGAHVVAEAVVGVVLDGPETGAALGLLPHSHLHRRRVARWLHLHQHTGDPARREEPRSPLVLRALPLVHHHHPVHRHPLTRVPVALNEQRPIPERKIPHSSHAVPRDLVPERGHPALEVKSQVPRGAPAAALRGHVALGVGLGEVLHQPRAGGALDLVVPLHHEARGALGLGPLGHDGLEPRAEGGERGVPGGAAGAELVDQGGLADRDTGTAA
mmetsp:Transcript_6206/g.13384  ORF Transcript_6206/g.13384 Transcript_6206/m.13384 type:complete len:300 (-) Transcript_6206:1014-1913(-)